MIGIYDMLILYCLPTGSLTAVLDNATDKSAPIASITFYDTEERPVKTVSTTHLADTHEQTETTYTLDNQPRKVSHTLKYKDETYDDSYEYSYDRIGRLTGVTASWPWANITDVDIETDVYNSIGQLVSSGSGSSATAYSYDIRGAISGLSNSAVKQSITRNANGTISKIIDNGITHTFEYDNAGRLLSETSDNSILTNGLFSSTYTYDRNSNITSLTRTGYPAGMSYPAYPVDDLKMTYDGNRLVKVADYADEVMVEKSFDFYDGAHSATEYTYDANGNVTRDDNRRLTAMTYNALNLPSRIEVGKDEAGEAIIDYIYDGAGNKLGTRSLISYFSDRPLATYAIQEPCRAEDHDYIGNYEFKNGQVHRVNTPYGYMAMGMFFTYLRDYQGNNRNHASYYAYGLPVQGSEVKDPDPYLYGSKEFYSLRGVNIYDFHARTYAPDIARFMQPDPKADDYHWLSPYAYCGGDPINNIDPDGKNIAILIENGLIGHLALLIQQQDGSWSYYSVNGDKIYNITLGVSGGPYNDVEAGSWSSPQEFMDEAHETTKEELEKNPDAIINYDYSEAYEIETTPEQDKTIADTFTKIANEEDYDLTSNNCAHAVQRSLLEGKVLPPVITQTISPTSTGYTFEIQRPYTLIPQPYSAYSTIKLHNPNGTKIKKEK